MVDLYRTYSDGASHTATIHLLRLPLPLPVHLPPEVLLGGGRDEGEVPHLWPGVLGPRPPQQPRQPRTLQPPQAQEPEEKDFEMQHL